MTKIIRDLDTPCIENISRRGVLKGLFATGGLVLAVSVAAPQKAFAEAAKWGGDGMPHGTVNNPHVFISIAPDGTVSIVCHRSEMGTGVRTGMPLIVADELEADWSKVKVVQAPGDEVKYGNQDTDGSRSTRHGFLPMRQAGAAARMMLEAAAAQRWGVDVSDVAASNGEVIRKSSARKLSFGELAEDAAKMEVPSVDKLKLKDPSQFRYIGKEGTHLYDGFDITTGRAIYGQDVRLPGTKYAVIARPPVMGGKFVSYDATEARKVPGFVQIVEIPAPSYPLAFQPSGGIAVVADNTWAAMKARDALKITWDDGPHASYDSVAYRAAMEDTARKPGLSLRKEGDFAGAFASADKKVEGEYYIPHLAHATMEPPAATCRIVDGKAEVWTSVQSPQAAHDLVAKYLGLPGENVTVNVTLLGGGFGRRSKPDFAVEAALVSKGLGGAPVKVVWTREDDLHNGFYHTVSAERLQAGLDKDGKVVAWRHNSVAPTIFSLFMPDPKHEAVLEQGMGLVDVPFDVKNVSIENGEAEAHTKIGWFRSVSNIPHAFAVQSFTAELASAAGKDLRTFVKDLIGPARIFDVKGKVKDFWDYGENPDVYPVDTARYHGVIDLATEKAGWGRKLPNGHGLGLAVHRSFVTYVATVVEVAVDDDGRISIPRVDVALDCGPVVNPDRVRSQMEGAVIQGLGIALMTELSFKNGRVVQNNYDDYQVLRIKDAPRETHVHIVPHGYDVPLGGVGEPGVPPVAPAFANAVFAASGKRIRVLPFGQQAAKA
jgi:isoquinoline 1-oxidoreductase beta subunit